MYIVDYFTPMMLTQSEIDLKFEQLADTAEAHLRCLMSKASGEIIVNAILDDDFANDVDDELNITMSRMKSFLHFPMDLDTDQSILVVQRGLEGELEWWLITSFAV